MATTCPTRCQLVDFVLGKLDEHDEEVVSKHLHQCAQCAALVERLEAEVSDELLRLLRRSGSGEPFPEESECRQVLNRLKSLLSGPFGFALTQRQTELREERRPPQRLGQYEILERIGRGGMGTVYKARHVRLDRVVALKVLGPERTTPSAVARFEREMKAIGGVEHPNVVRAFDADEEEGFYYIVMDFVDGVSLSALVKRLGPLPVPDACELARQAALGLQAIHEHGLVHRDVKPSNLMLTRSGQVKVLDLGLSRLRRELVEADVTASGTVVGTVDYIAPEQCGDSRHVTIRADLYSLGCTLYELLCGHPPFSGPKYKTWGEKIAGHVFHTPVPIEERRTEVPPGLATVVRRLLQKKPEDRYAEPLEVAEALAPFAQGSDLARLVRQAERAGQVPGSTVGEECRTVWDQGAGRPAASTTKTRPLGRVFLRRRAAVVTALLFLVFAAGALFFLGPWNTEKWTGSLKESQPRSGRQGTGLYTATAAGRERVGHAGVADAKAALEGPASADEDGLDGKDVGDGNRQAGAGRLVAARSERGRQPGPSQPTLAELVSEGLASREENLSPGTVPRAGLRKWGLFPNSLNAHAIDGALSPDGRLVAALTHSGVVYVWDWRAGRLLFLLPHLCSGQVGATNVLWHPDGRHLAVLCRGRVDLWRLEGHTARPLWSFRPPTVRYRLPPSRHRCGRGRFAAFSPDGRWLANAMKDGSVAIVEVETGRVLRHLLGHVSFVTAVDWSPADDCLASGSADGTVVLWNRTDWRARLTLKPPSAGVVVAWLRFSPDGQSLAVGYGSLSGGDARAARILLVDTQTGAARAELPAPNTTHYALAWSPDGRYLLATGWPLGHASLWNLNERKRLAHEFAPELTAVSFTDDLQTVALFQWNGRVSVWEPSGLREDRWRPATAPSSQVLAGRNYYTPANIHFSPNGRFWTVCCPRAAGLVPQAVWLWDTADATVRAVVRGYDWGVPTNDGTKLAVFRSDDGRPPRVWDVTERRFGAEWSGLERVKRAAWSPDGQWLAAGAASAVSVWDASSGKGKTLEHDLGLAPVAWSRDGRRLAAASNEGVLVWERDGRVFRNVGRFPCPVREPQRVAWSEDSSKLAVASTHELAVLDASSGRLLNRFELEVGYGLAWTNQDRKLLVGQPRLGTRGESCGAVVAVDLLTGRAEEVYRFRAFRTWAISPAGRHVVAGSGGLRVHDLAARRLVYTTFLFVFDPAYMSAPLSWVAVSTDGHYRGSAGVERFLACVAQTDQGLVTLTPEEFSARFGWKNEPERVGLPDESEAGEEREGPSVR